MKLARFNNSRTGLLIDTPTGRQIIDVMASLKAIAPQDLEISNMLDAASNTCNWDLLIADWSQIRSALYALAETATTTCYFSSPDLVTHAVESVQIDAFLDVTEFRKVTYEGISDATRDRSNEGETSSDRVDLTQEAASGNPTGWDVMMRQFALGSKGASQNLA